MHPHVPLPWERLLWSGRARFPHASRARYILTDFRLVRIDGHEIVEIALHDIGDVHRNESRLDRLSGTSTITVQSRRTADTVVLHGIRRGHQFAALLDLLSGEPRAVLDVDAINATLSWNPRVTSRGYRESLAGLAIVLIAVFGVAIGLHGKADAVVYSPDDRIYPNGQKRSQAEIVAFMQRDVMPWARVTPPQSNDKNMNKEMTSGLCFFIWETPASGLGA